MSIVFRDFGTAYLAAPLTVGGVSLTVDNATWLPSLAAGDYFYLVLQKYSDRSYVEIVKCTATSGNVLTIVRAQSGTAARSFAIGDYAELRLTSDGFSEFVAQGLSAKMDKIGGDFSGLVRFLAPSTARFDLVRSSDNVAAGVVLDFSATEGHRTIVGGGTGSNVVTPSLLLRPNGYSNGTGQVRVDSAGLVDGVAFEMRAAQQTKVNSLVRYDTLSNYVLGTRAINNHALTSDFSITADEVFSAGATVNANARFQASDFQYRQADGAYGVRLAVSSAIGYLQSGKVDSTAAEQKLYLTGWMGNPLSLFKVYSDNPLYRRKAGVDYPLYDALNKPTIDDVTGLSEALLQAGGSPVLAAVWVQLRAAMWNGHVAADGQVLNRADYPDAWAAIQAGKVPVVTDSEWLADPYKRASFTAGDGTTTFRLPDYNGKSVGSVGRAYLGGDGLNSAVTNGIIQGDAIRNITGGIEYVKTNASAAGKGAFTATKGSSVHGAIGTADNILTAFDFSAALVVPTAADNHPITATGCWAIKLFGAVQDAGSIDAAGLATQIAELQSPRPINSIDWQGQVANRNILINGDFKVNQRVLGQESSVLGYKFVADRWLLLSAGAVLGHLVSNSITGVPAKQALQLIGAAGNTQLSVFQRVEAIDCQFDVGQKLSFGVYVHAPAGKNITLRADSFNAVDSIASGVTSVASKTFASVGGWQFFSFTFASTRPCRDNGMQVSVSVDGGLGAGQTFYLTNAQLERGEATVFEVSPYSVEFAKCRRYFRASKATNPYAYMGPVGVMETANGLRQSWDISGMRRTPTVAVSGGFSGESIGGGLAFAGGGLVGDSFYRLDWTTSSASTPGYSTNVRDSGGTNARVAFDAEL